MKKTTLPGFADPTTVKTLPGFADPSPVRAASNSVAQQERAGQACHPPADIPLAVPKTTALPGFAPAAAPPLPREGGAFDRSYPARNNNNQPSNYPGTHGDFAGDLLPATGLQDPRFHGTGGMHDGRMGGNLMGPNHPMFSPASGGYPGPGMGGGGPGSMQPRFDPVFPSHLGRGPPPPGGRRPYNNPSRSGEPNPDHLPPPNSLGGSDYGNMYM